MNNRKGMIGMAILTLLTLPVVSAGQQGPKSVVTDMSVLGELPASFAGRLPCADCEGIDYRVNLFDDKSWFLTTIYAGKLGDKSFDDIGSWALSSDKQVLVLKGGREAPLMFTVADSNTLRKRDIEGNEIDSSLDYSLKREDEFQMLEPRLPMTGMYTYMADAGLFNECLGGQTWPVAHEGDNAALERAYGEARRQPGDRLLVSLEGQAAMRPGMDGGALHTTLIVEKFIGIWPGETCGTRFATEELMNAYWKLTRLLDEPVIVQTQQREPHLMFRADDQGVAGFDGCNRIKGTYLLDDNAISFGPMAGTMMACPEQIMDAASAFTGALARVQSWNIKGQHLELYDADENMLMRLEARAL